MNKSEFMKRLEYLLSDIPDEEKADAFDYYRDYLEEAGPEQEEEVIRGFGSPERIASIIRSDLYGNLEDGGAFTENGYEDERFRDPNYQVIKRYDLPEAFEYQTHNEKNGEEKTGNKNIPQPANRIVKIILWVVLILVALPAVLGIGGGALGLLSGLIGCLLAAVIVVGAGTIAFLVSGAALLVIGVVSVAIHPLSGILVLGLGILLLGFGLLALAVSGIFYGKFLPFLFESSVNMISRLFHRRRGSL